MPTPATRSSVSSTATPFLLRGLATLLALLGILLACKGVYALIQPITHAISNWKLLCFSILAILLTTRVLWLSAKEFLQLFSGQPDHHSILQANLRLQASTTACASSFVAAIQNNLTDMTQPERTNTGSSIRIQQPSPAQSTIPAPGPAMKSGAFAPPAPIFDWSQAQSQPLHPSSTPDRDERNAMERQAILYTPIEQDPIFQLDNLPISVRRLMLPKEGEPLIECQDRYALDATKHCYALADGVSNSFVPGPWARIVSQHFVACGGQWSNEEAFGRWLDDCRQQWFSWIEERWVPTMNAMRRNNGEMPLDWRNDIRKGAQTTLIGCTLHPSPPESIDAWQVHIQAIGDCDFLLFRPDIHYEWRLLAAYPCKTPEAFGARPYTLMTLMRPDLVERSWLSRQVAIFPAQPGDLIVLATDSLAKWLLTQIRQQGTSWKMLLNAPQPDALEQELREELHRGHIEDDDLTMLAISVPSFEETNIP